MNVIIVCRNKWRVNKTSKSRYYKGQQNMSVWIKISPRMDIMKQKHLIGLVFVCRGFLNNAIKVFPLLEHTVVQQ